MKLILTTLLIVFQLSYAQAKPAPAVAGFSSMLLPGLGQTLNGNALEGLAYAGVSAMYFLKNPYFSNIGFNIWLYNQYDAYRDAGAPGTAKHSIYENWISNVNPLNLVDLIAAPTVGFAAGYGYYTGGGYPSFQRWEIPVSYSFVGLGEEALFRGFWFHGLSRLFGTEWVGAPISSLAFAAAHVIGGVENLELNPMAQRFIFGMLMSWQMSRNQYDMRKNIFTHSWYNIFIDRGNSINFRWVIPLIP
ncbi:MAG: CPBP family intramembrane metalloprotease [Xanthomonadaceae bacterium]|nr:CPBP family intramembrane metalloprotease [Xanthomonadaceae bacterium]